MSDFCWYHGSLYCISSSGYLFNCILTDITVCFIVLHNCDGYRLDTAYKFYAFLQKRRSQILSKILPFIFPEFALLCLTPRTMDIKATSKPSCPNPVSNFITQCVSRIVTFIIKNIDLIILFACLVGFLESSHVEKNEAQSLKNCLGLCLDWSEYRHAHASARARAHAFASVLMRATVLGTLCIFSNLKYSGRKCKKTLPWLSKITLVWSS